MRVDEEKAAATARYSDVSAVMYSLDLDDDNQHDPMDQDILGVASRIPTEEHLFSLLKADLFGDKEEEEAGAAATTAGAAKKPAAASRVYAKPKTKIVCTLGPKSRDVAILERLLRAGMNVARFNFSHGSHEYHQETLNNLRAASANTGIMCAVLLDTKGPEIRTGFLKGGTAVLLQQGSQLTITTDYDVKGDASLISMSYKNLPNDVVPGGKILCADGSITLVVLSTDPAAGTVQCRCENTAWLGERKNVNLPGVVVDLPTITEKDKSDILEWGVPNNIDFIAASFVRKGSDLSEIRSILGPEAAKRIHIISKIENQEGLVNFDAILAASDGIMVARGDLGMEIPTEKVFLAQKLMIFKCNAAGKPVVTATQMLESMIKSPRPTRAEATDVANAVLDGTDAVMLSGETAAGSYPEQAVGTMARICREAEGFINNEEAFRSMMNNATLPMSSLESLASSAVRTAHKVQARLILVVTTNCSTPRLVAKYRPHVPTMAVAVSHPEAIRDPFCVVSSHLRQLLLIRGSIPMPADTATPSPSMSDEEQTDIAVAAAFEKAKSTGLVADGDAVVVLHRFGASVHLQVVRVS